MPRNVRNFWVTAEADGYKTPVQFGPGTADGGFRMEIHIRENGKISDKSVTVVGDYYDGQLYLVVQEKKTGQEIRVTTRR